MPLTTNILRGGIAIDEILVDPNGRNNFDTDGNGTADALDEFVEIHNQSANPIDISGLQLWDAGQRNWFTFPDGTILGAGKSAVVIASLQPGGSLPATTDGNLAFNANSDRAILQNNGDNVVLYDPTADQYIQLTYNDAFTHNPPFNYSNFSRTATRVGFVEEWGENVDGVSLVRFPAGNENIVLHNTLSPDAASPGAATRVVTNPVTGWAINEILADPAFGLTGDANGDGAVDASQDEFVELVNNTGVAADISGWTLSDSAGVRHTFSPGTIVPQNGAIVVFGGGRPTGLFGNAIVQTASTGALDLDDINDTVTLSNGLVDVATYTYGLEAGNDQSINLNPDLSGVDPLTQHSLIVGSGGRLFSPGTQVNGMAFPGNVTFDNFPIFQIQGTSHISPLTGRLVSTAGIVTAVESDGFYLQDPRGDGNNATSDAIFVFTGTAPTVAVGDLSIVSGRVGEFTLGGVATRNLSVTQISGNPVVTTFSSGNPLPPAVLLGTGGRTPPTDIVDDDNFTRFDPDTDGIDFYESLEGMRVTVQNAVAVSPSNELGEIFTLADNGLGATGTSTRGTIHRSATDANPERIQVQVDRDLLPGFAPTVNVGDTLGNVTGVVDYSNGNFEVKATDLFAPVPGGLQPETTTLVGTADQLTIASLNGNNLDPAIEQGASRFNVDDDIGSGKFAAIANQIVNNLKNPDIIALQDIQDNSGADDDGTVDASLTYQTLINAITAAGGVGYQFFDLPPTNGQDGGMLGGNSRVGYLYNPGRVGVVPDSGKRIGVDALGADLPGFTSARKSLATTFSFNGENVTLVNNDFSPQSGSSALFGSVQPPVNGGAAIRNQQAFTVNDFVGDLLEKTPDANVVVLGNFNEFDWGASLQTLKGDDLLDLTETLPENERYSSILDGNASALDRAFISNNLSAITEFDIVHTNSEFANTPSDRDPLLTRISLPNAPTVPDVFPGDLDNPIVIPFDIPDLGGVIPFGSGSLPISDILQDPLNFNGNDFANTLQGIVDDLTSQIPNLPF
ncbi:lamin tail domain-containing protein [Lusitaniella coriacea LEGE 07157]|uniref:Lamin tail domain-containing protein n=1 Tax=Lusitaniella coriacea LEGE 07157 TaxID=945747 RepID=A0A8J7JEN4_9CYAN|nr:lamin tail domain-containing protein [Lusitaniella coriacea]MBE9118335.1 lamin tail domain-containing protein [Lusitaniella coriacea LEGE 07157]